MRNDVEYLEGLWATDDLRFRVGDFEDNLQLLNTIVVDSRFDAVFHTDSLLLEFLFTYVDPADEWGGPILDRSFTLHYQGVDLACSFSAPTQGALTLARATQVIPSDRAERFAPQLRILRDGQRTDELVAPAREFFEGKVPRSFFVSIEQKPSIDWLQLARHINLLAAYYDRETPRINIRQFPPQESTSPTPKRFLQETFPIRLTAQDVDDVLLTLLEVAERSSPRPTFMCYYQVFEYAGHYYIDESARKELKRLLRDPSLASCDDKKVGELFSVLSDLHHQDEQRMQRVVEEHVDAQHLWHDVASDVEFFSQPVKFDGGLEVERLVSKEATPDTWRDAFRNLFRILTKIRNCIVHAREKRESKMILPTKENEAKIKRYLPLIRRMAEDVAFRA